ncbi:TaqI-like C-terminal specificity domain-containing protein [Empedobacter tilapiae]
MKRYSYDFADLYLLYIPWHFPLHKDPNIKGASLEAEEAFMNQYPAIYNHLLNFKKELSNRNQAETGIRYEWYALQRWGANYMDDFFRPKVIYPNMTKFLPFVLDYKSMITNQKCYIITGENIEFLAAFLNSNLFKVCFKDNFPELLGGTRELSKVFFEKIPVIKISSAINENLKLLFEQFYKNELSNNELYSLINSIIISLYDLKKEEIEFINSQ